MQQDQDKPHPIFMGGQPPSLLGKQPLKMPIQFPIGNPKIPFGQTTGSLPTNRLSIDPKLPLFPLPGQAPPPITTIPQVNNFGSTQQQISLASHPVEATNVFEDDDEPPPPPDDNDSPFNELPETANNASTSNTTLSSTTTPPSFSINFNITPQPGLLPGQKSLLNPAVPTLPPTLITQKMVSNNDQMNQNTTISPNMTGQPNYNQPNEHISLSSQTSSLEHSSSSNEVINTNPHISIESTPSFEQKHSVPDKPKLHPLLPCHIPQDAPLLMSVHAPTDPFPLRFLVDNGAFLQVECSPQSTVIECLTDFMFELLPLVKEDQFDITSNLLCGDEIEIIDNSSIIGESNYIQQFLARGAVPSVLLRPSTLLDDFELDILDIPDNSSIQTSVITEPTLINQTTQPINTQTLPATISTQPQTRGDVAVSVAAEINKMKIDPTTGLPMAEPLVTPSNAPQILSINPAALNLGSLPTQTTTISNTTSTSDSIVQFSRSSRVLNNRPSVASFAGSRKSIFEKPGILKPAHATLSSMRKDIVEILSFDCKFALSETTIIDLTINEKATIAEIKSRLCQHVKQTMGVDMGPSQYLIKIPGASFITNENEILKTLPYVHNCIMRGSKPLFMVLDKSSQTAKRVKKNSVEIGALIGRPLSWVQQDDEITYFRQSMTRLRFFQRQSRDETLIRAEQDQISGFPIHVGTRAQPTGPNNQTLISLNLELLQVKKKVPVKADDTAEAFIQLHVDKYYIKQGKTTKPPSSFILKPAGLAEYLYGPYALHSFDYFRECLAKNKPVELMLVDISDLQSKSPTSTGASSPTSDSIISASTHSSSQSLSAGSINAGDEVLEDESFLLEDPAITYDQKEIRIGVKPAEKMTCLSVWDIHRPFQIKIIGIENISPQSNSFMAAYSSAVSSSSGKIPSICDDTPLYMYITVDLFHGGEQLDHTWCSHIVPASNNPRWYEYARFSHPLSNLPRAVRICFTAWVAKRPIRSEYSDIPLGWVNCQLFDYKHELRTGRQHLKMWPDEKANPIGTCVSNDGKNPTSIYFDLDTYQLPVVFPTEPFDFPPYPVPTSMTNTEQDRLSKLIASDPLYRLNTKDKQLIWKYREFCKTRPKALPKFLASVPKTDPRAVQEMYRLLKIWSPIEPIDALELLDSEFADAKVREYAVKRLEHLSREELLDYLLQLVQVIKYEPYHSTAFAELLLKAALSNRAIGHHFFWYLKSEIHVPEISERFGLLLEAYLRGCGNHRTQLAAQNDLQMKLVIAANLIKPLKDSERLAALHQELAKIPFPNSVSGGISIPLNPRIEISGLKIEKCKYMDSKKLPLWLVFKNADPKGSDPFVIFKSGDDLRQDMLTLQMIRIMDHLWKKADLDFLLSAYGCISTGDEVGMIEVVLNSMTTAAITRIAGGATAAFREDPIDNWIRENNPTEGAYKLARDRFIYSCAGYCVATYVLGIGDRHNDNIMITKDGRLFHIDFGHFLGNYKKKFGVKRERAPFVFTPDFAYVMGGKDSADFKRFLDLCAKAYNVLRKHANIFINLFAMMLSTGIPELRSIDDITYLRDAFSLDLTEQQAAEKFTELVYESMSSRTTQINNAIHIWAH